MESDLLSILSLTDDANYDHHVCNARNGENPAGEASVTPQRQIRSSLDRRILQRSNERNKYSALSPPNVPLFQRWKEP